MGLRSRVMEVPLLYNFFQMGIGKSKSRNWFVDEIIEPYLGQRILDIGCGTASILGQLNGASYLGIDHNPKYIAQARSKFGVQGKFECINLNDLSIGEHDKFDAALLIGVLHHLREDEVEALLSKVSSLLNTDGKLVTFDCAIVNGQHLVARLLAKLDRGRFVRSPQHYRALIERAFDVETEIVRHDLLKVPYTHAVFRAKPK